MSGCEKCGAPTRTIQLEGGDEMLTLCQVCDRQHLNAHDAEIKAYLAEERAEREGRMPHQLPARKR